MALSRFLFLLFFLWILGSVTSVSAATLYLSPSQTELNRGDSVQLALRLDVDKDECVNAIDGVISYSNNIEPIDISRGNSIMSLWVEEPKIDRQARTITFMGGIPNGYCGRIVGDPRLTNTIVEMIFQSPGFVVGGGQGTSSDKARVDIAEETQVTLNDGFGSMAPLMRYGTDIALKPNAGAAIQNEWSERVLEDQTPPESFAINLVQTPNAFSGRYFITFNTSDKQSGIDHFEIMEEPIDELFSFRWGAEDAPWTEARSPYELKDQSLNSTIRVKAIDKAGNEYVATYVPDEAMRTISSDTWMTIMVAVAVIVVLISMTLIAVTVWRRRLKKKEVLTLEENEDEESNL